MLPFLKTRKLPQVITSHKAPDNKDEKEDVMETIAKDMLQAIEASDHKALAAALYAADYACQAAQEDDNASDPVA